MAKGGAPRLLSAGQDVASAETGGTTMGVAGIRRPCPRVGGAVSRRRPARANGTGTVSFRSRMGSAGEPRAGCFPRTDIVRVGTLTPSIFFWIVYSK